MDLKTLIDAFLASYQGRDPSLLTRLAFWRERLGHQPIIAIDADMVDAEMAHLAARGALKFVRGTGIVPANRPLSPATLNRQLVALGSVRESLSYCLRTRIDGEVCPQFCQTASARLSSLRSARLDHSIK